MSALYRWIFSISLQFLYGCVSYHSSPHSARIVTEDETSTGFLFQYSNEHDQNILSRRLKSDFGSNFDEGLPQSGFGLTQRWGLTERTDWGVLLYSGLAAMDLRYQIYVNESYALAVSGMMGITPFFPEDKDDLSTYLTLQQSYDLFSTFTVLYHIHGIYFPYPEGKKFLGGSLGFLLGRENGFVFEWSYYQAVGRKKSPESLDQFVVGYSTKIGRLNSRNLSANQKNPDIKDISIFYDVGSTLSPNLAMGLIIEGQPQNEYPFSLSLSYGLGPLPPSVDRAYEGLVSSGFIAVSTRKTWDSLFFRAGIARRDVRINIDLEQGWRRVAVLSHGPELAIGQIFDAFSIEWFGVYLPLRWLPGSKRFLTGSGQHFDPNGAVSGLAERYYSLPSVSLLKFQSQI